MKLPQFHPGKKLVKTMLWLSWPVIIAGKKLSSYPLFKWIIYPFFSYPYSEVTAIPINEKIDPPDSLLLPQRIVEKIIRSASGIFILDECICRGKLHCGNYPVEIGCMALGPPATDIHRSHGHIASADEAVQHLHRAARAGLISTIAHAWIDPLAFGLRNFNKLMFICFCDDCCCLYRTHMKKRGPSLNRAYRRLPGISISLAGDSCTGCGKCAESCFVANISIVSGKAVIGSECKGCGRCVEVCSEGALSLELAGEDELLRQISSRIQAVADIT